VEPINGFGRFYQPGSENPVILGTLSQARIRGPIVDGEARKKDRRRRLTGASKRMDQAVDNDAGTPGETHGAGLENGLSPTLQAHIGRHVRAVFDEVAREPIPEHLLRLLKDLEQGGEK
jgi:hypothetical protein